MNKIDFIKDFASKIDGWERQALIPALVSCLTSEDVAQALDPMSLNDPILRRALLSRVTRDIETRGCQPYHTTLIKNLISSFQSLPTNKKQSCGYFLNSLYNYVPSDLQMQIVSFFTTSRYAAMRSRGYKILRHNWNSEYESIVVHSWKEYREYYCARLIVEHFPDAFLNDNFDDLEKALMGKEGAPQLYIRVGKKNPDILQRLAKQDGITFAYVTLKLGKSLSPQQASAIFEQFKFDNRIGLFIWCLGRMKLWHILENIAKSSEQLNEEKLAWYRKKYGI